MRLKQSTQSHIKADVLLVLPPPTQKYAESNEIVMQISNVQKANLWSPSQVHITGTVRLGIKDKNRSTTVQKHKV